MSHLRERIQITPFWKLTSWGFYPFTNWRLGFGFDICGRGGDEWGNDSVYLTIPLIARFVYFKKEGFDRSTWFLSGTCNNALIFQSPDGRWEAEISPEDYSVNDWDEGGCLEEEKIQSLATKIQRIFHER